MTSNRLWVRLGITATVAVALIPVLSMLVFLLTTGENSIRDDGMIAARFGYFAESGRLDVQRFLKSIYATGHIILFPLLFQLAVYFLADLNEYVLVSFGWLSSVLRWLLLFDLLTFKKSGWQRWLYLPILASFVFLPSQIPQYSFGFASLQYFFSHLGFTVGLWALVRFPHTGRAVWIAAVAGIFASWSSGLGPLSWPVFALTMLTLGYRRRWQWLTIVFAGAAALIPYCYFLTSDTYFNAGVKFSPDLLNIRLMLAELGWAFFRLDAGTLRMVGLTGVVLLITGILACVLALRNRTRALPFRQLIPPFMIVAFGVLTVIQIAALRGGLGAHRSAQFLTFWIGVVVIALELLVWFFAGRHLAGREGYRFVYVPVWSATALAIIGCFALRATDFDDYIHFLRTRAPASAACLREYRTAPTYCRNLVFNPERRSLASFHQLGNVLEKGKISVFGQRQRWTMQGDTVLGTVRGPMSTAGESVWVKGKHSHGRLAWSSYRRLNLVLPARDTVEWTVTLPVDLVWAEFESAVTLEPSGRAPGAAAEHPVSVTVSTPDSEHREVFSTVLTPTRRAWKPINFSLTGSAGSTVTVHLSSRAEAETTAASLIFRYPRIELEVDAGSARSPRTPLAPRNTDKSPDFPATTGSDHCFDLANTSSWAVHGMSLIGHHPSGGWSWQLSSEIPSLISTEDLGVDLRDFSHLLIRQRGDGGHGADYDLSFRFANGDSRDVSLALFNDQDLHSYVYDLRLLEAPRATLETLKMTVHSAGFGVSEGTVLIEKICLVGRPGPQPHQP